MPIHEEVRDAVGNTNYKMYGEYPSTVLAEILEDKRILTKAMDEDMIRGRQRMNGALDSMVIRAGKDIAEPDMAEAKAIVKQDTGVDLASQGHHLAQTMSQLNQTLPNLVAMLNALVAGNQQILKGAQSTNPQTGHVPA